MKFARYLQDALTPEWKDAYIDYCALKKHLRAIQADDTLQLHVLSYSPRTIVDLTIPNTEGKFKETHVDRPSVANLPPSETDSTRHFGDLDDIHARASPVNERMSHQSISPFFKDPESPTPRTLHTILSNVPATHVKFFDVLDAELTKVEEFYLEREKGMHEHAKLLKKQLHELETHRQMFYESSAQSNARSWVKRAYLALFSPSRFSKSKTKSKGLRQADRDSDVLPEPKRRRLGFVGTPQLKLENRRLTVDCSGSWNKEDDLTKETIEMDDSSGALDDFIRMRLQRLNTLRDQQCSGTRHRFDPQEYQQAKRRLRKAVSEHYRGLEALNNYRALNLAGFRKTLRKYEKITQISVLDTYMKERVALSAFGSGALVSAMIKEMEHHFAVRFEHGDRKKAVGHLRVGSTSRTYHLSTFRSGWWLGLALPAVVAGSYLSFQEYTRTTLPSWNILLFVYSILFIPVLLAVLIGINIVAWTRNKINYVFIFQLNPRSRLDCHQYFELPSFLLCALSYAFWFSLAQIGPPMLWPLIWLILTFVVMFNPFRCFMWGRTRWWAIKKIAKLATTGMYEVEFTDVWLGDLMCSLMYSFSNLFFVGCFYTRFALGSPTSSLNYSEHASPSVNFTSLYQVEPSASVNIFQNLLDSAYDHQAQTAWSTCAAPENWGWYFLLGMLPFLVRFVQCLRRYRDTKLSAQLLNAGKYGMGIIYTFFYYRWRNQMNNGERYVLWCFIAALDSIYGYLWDILMDWAMCRPGSHYLFLRPQLLYSSHIPYYYFAIISDLFLRFMWVSYIFLDEANFERGMFIIGVLEMLRRVQWNFFRLENKHLNNMNLHRVTREVPLPYECVVDTLDEEARAHLQMRKRLAHLS